MQRRLWWLAATVLLAFLPLSGCVTTGTYHQKELEAQGLEQALQDQKNEYRKLQAENAELKSETARLNHNLTDLGAERARVSAEKKGLEESLKATSDAKNQRIGELSQKLADLDAENKHLKDDLAQLQKQKEIEVQKTSRTYEDLLEQMKSEISKGEVTISELKGKLTVNLVESVLFDSGKAEVKPNGLLVLQKVVDILGNVKDKAIRIEGHTDNVPIAGALARRYPTNWELSAARAINVTRYLQLQGIDPAVLAAVAFGEHKPVAPNDTEEGRAKNRRIEIVLVSKE